MFEVRCQCGNLVAVAAVQAGTAVGCPCGLAVDVPSLSALRRVATAAGPPPTPGRGNGGWRGVALLVCGESIWLLGLPLLAAWDDNLTAAGFLIVFSLGQALSLTGVLTIGLSRGYALWLCVLLCWIPIGRYLILILPGPEVSDVA